MSFLRKYSFYLIIVLLSLFALAPLFQPGFFPMHDDEQVGRLYELDQSLKAGNIPVRISQNLGFGYGYPLFNFYPSFIYYFAEAFVLVGIGYITSIKLMIASGFILATFFMYLFSKEYLGKYGALVAAAAYTYVPYHSVDVYVRGALPEFWSFVFVPALFWTYKKLVETHKKMFVIIAAVLFAGLILTHNLIAMMSGIFIGIYLIFLLSQTKRKKQFIQLVVLSGLLGLALSASFWIPSFFERNATMISLLTTELADYNQHFVYLRQLWNSPWGYGGSLYGLEDGLSFQIGKIHLIGSLLAFLVGVWMFAKKNAVWKIIALFSFMLLVAGFMTTFYSKFIWDTLQFFSYIQFPWRFLLFTAFTSSFLVGALLVPIKSQKLQFLVSVALCVALVFFYKNYFTPEKYLTKVTDINYTSNDVIRWRTSIMAFEYVPKGVATKRSSNNTTVIDINRNEIASSSSTMIKGTMKVQEIVAKPQYKKFNVSGSGGILRINTFSFPGWKVFIDTKEVTYTDANKFKLIDVNVPAGQHVIEAYFTDTPLRVAGNIISAASIIGVLLYIIVILRKKYE